MRWHGSWPSQTDVQTVFVAPGNAGTARESGVENIPIGSDDLKGLRDFAGKKHVELTIVGPESPLVEGIVDQFDEAGLKCFGPSSGAARLEGSKVFCKDFLARHHIPTASYKAFTDLTSAKAYIHEMGTPLVVKADGLAAGKGVIIAQTEAEAVDTAAGMLDGESFGEAGKRIVVEECLKGEEASFIVMVDGSNILPLATSQDHKARDDGDLGPNTGGMGAYSPAPVVTPALHDRIMKDVIEPTVKGMAAEGNPYRGFLYAGVMISSNGTPNVLEYNCRFGDPETQPIILRLQSDLAAMCLAAMEQNLDQLEVKWDDRAALGVVMAADGYPVGYQKGDVITGLPEKEMAETKIFHAGTALKDDQVVTSGGRVLCATALGTTVSEAQTKAYELARRVQWRGVYYRRDIGYRAVNREKQAM